MKLRGNEFIKLINESDLIKSYCSIPKEWRNIVKVSHNSVHRQVGEGKYNAVFYGKRKYKDHITTNMLINMANEGVFRHLECKYGKEAVWDAYYNVPIFKPALLKYASGSFTPDADEETSTVDGYVNHTDGAGLTWNDLRIAAGNGSNDSAATGNIFRLSGDGNDGKWDDCVRSVFLFDTSSIGAGKTVTAADFKFYVDSLNDAFSQTVDIVSSNPASNTALANTDYDYNDFGTTALATGIAVGSISTSAYNTWTFNASGKSAVTVDGITKLGGRGSGDRTNTEPDWADSTCNVLGKMADNGENEPTLDVTYSALNASSLYFTNYYY